MTLQLYAFCNFILSSELKSSSLVKTLFKDSSLFWDINLAAIVNIIITTNSTRCLNSERQTGWWSIVRDVMDGAELS